MTGWVVVMLAAATLVFSGVSFVAVGLDKRQARLGRWRIRERTLHTLEFLGGWPGSWAGRRVFRHKTQDLNYRIKAGLIIALHATAWAALALTALGRAGS